MSGDVEKARPTIQTQLSKGEVAAKRAIELDPKSADGYLALAEMRYDAGDVLSGIELVKQALALDPDLPEALQAYSIRLANLGYLKQALPVRDHLSAVEPFVPAYRAVNARLLFASGQTDAALTILKSQTPGPLLSQIYAAQGHYREAADILAGLDTSDRDPTASKVVQGAVRLLRAAPAPTPANDRPELGILDWVYIYAGDPERFLFAYEKGVRMGFRSGGNNGLEWAPAYSAIRKTERFKKYVRDAGMVAYWRAKGWPDLCHPIGADDFACD